MTSTRCQSRCKSIAIIPLGTPSRSAFLSIILMTICCLLQTSDSFVVKVSKFSQYGTVINSENLKYIRHSGSTASLDVSTANPLEHSSSPSSSSSRITSSSASSVSSPVDSRSWLSKLNLPVLTMANKKALALGERVQMQHRDGRSGKGIVVLDVHAPPEVVFELLTRFKGYESFIPTVRSVTVYGQTEKTNSATFSLSKFCLKVNVVHTVIPEEKTISFTLDKSKPNLVMRQADGFWHVQAPVDRPEGYTRVYLSANIIASRVVPTILVDYAAARALPRATTWMQEHFI